MPWVRASLRGQTVYARADETGAFLAEKGVVEIRYKPKDGRRYQARTGNLSLVDGKVLPDDTCGPAEAVQKPAAGASAPAGGASRGSSKTTARGIPQAGPVPEGAVVVYADGACSGNPGPAGLGAVVIDGGRRVELSEYLGVGTNNIAELTAILRSLDEVTDPARPIVIHTDSQYSIGVLQKGWKAKANAELIASLRAALASRPNTRIVYVPGHAGVQLNERADALAREAVRDRTSKRAVYPPEPARAG